MNYKAKVVFLNNKIDKPPATLIIKMEKEKGYSANYRQDRKNIDTADIIIKNRAKRYMYKF